jgi:diguanylate cyclase (GGDEF)-like protein
MSHRSRYLIASALAGLSVPFFWLLWRAFSLRRSWWISWFEAEWNRNAAFYLVLGFCAVSGFMALGYILGKMRDDRRVESEEAMGDHEALADMAARDGLTGLFNARYVHERLELDMEEAAQAPLACLLVDIDHFKKINDTHGHPCGDAVLVAVASAMRRSVRRVDSVGRLGGEEFLVILPDTPATRATIVAERIREAVAAEAVEQDGKSVRATVSVGVVTYPADGLTDRATLLKAADSALYAAKRAGRNRVMIWEAG